MSLFSFFTRSQAGGHTVPEGQRVYAIGDIHGRLDLLDALLEQIRADDEARGGAETQLIFLGDYVDRGPSSKQVVDRMIELRDGPTPTRFLVGNHEQLFLNSLAGDQRTMRVFIRNGGKETLFSYGIDSTDYSSSSLQQLIDLMGQLVPPEHVSFISSLEHMIEVGDYLFVHAGIRPGLALEAQSTSELCWIRGEFLNHRDSFGKMVVHGHTIRDEPEVRSNRIGIDTGAFHSGRLTALGLEGGERWFLST